MRCLMLMLLFSPVLARATTVAVMPVEAPEREADGLRVLRALRAAVTEAGLTDKGDIKLNVPEARLSFSCFDEDPACMAQVGAILEAEQLVWARITADGAGYQLKLNRLDIAQARVLRAEAVKVADLRGLEAACQAFIKGAPMPEVAAVPPRSRVTFESVPPGAQIWIDHARMGETPASIDLVHGSYQLELRHPDAPNPVQQAIEIGPDTRVIRLSLGVAGHVDEPVGPQRSYRNLWFALGGVGVAAIGAGLAAKGASDGEAAGSDAQRPNLTRAEYDGLKSDYESAQVLNGVGWGLVGVGLAGAGTFLALHFMDDGVAVGPSGQGVSLTAHF